MFNIHPEIMAKMIEKEAWQEKLKFVIHNSI